MVAAATRTTFASSSWTWVARRPHQASPSRRESQSRRQSRPRRDRSHVGSRVRVGNPSHVGSRVRVVNPSHVGGRVRGATIRGVVPEVVVHDAKAPSATPVDSTIPRACLIMEAANAVSMPPDASRARRDREPESVCHIVPREDSALSLERSHPSTADGLNLLRRRSRPAARVATGEGGLAANVHARMYEAIRDVARKPAPSLPPAPFARIEQVLCRPNVRCFNPVDIACRCARTVVPTSPAMTNPMSTPSFARPLRRAQRRDRPSEGPACRPPQRSRQHRRLTECHALELGRQPRPPRRRRMRQGLDGLATTSPSTFDQD